MADVDGFYVGVVGDGEGIEIFSGDGLVVDDDGDEGVVVV